MCFIGLELDIPTLTALINIIQLHCIENAFKTTLPIYKGIIHNQLRHKQVISSLTCSCLIADTKHNSIRGV